MQIAKNKVVSINYTLTDPQGSVLDSSSDREPLVYLHGTGSLITGLETALEGHKTGDALSVDIAPKDAYGERDEELVQALPRDRFRGVRNLEVGMQLQGQTEAGPQVIRVVKVEDDAVTVDANHELAGMPLHFEVTVVEVRDATKEELSHGHVHGPGGHHH